MQKLPLIVQRKLSSTCATPATRVGSTAQEPFSVTWFLRTRDSRSACDLSLYQSVLLPLLKKIRSITYHITHHQHQHNITLSLLLTPHSSLPPTSHFTFTFTLAPSLHIIFSSPAPAEPSLHHPSRRLRYYIRVQTRIEWRRRSSFS